MLGFSSRANCRNSCTARCWSIWYRFFIATLSFFLAEKPPSAHYDRGCESRYFLRINGHPQPARAYFTLDDLGVLDQAERNPDSLLATRPVILDEVQRAPQILLAVKRAVDTHRQAGDFILTGSANLALMKHGSDTLAGRAIYLDLRPFCPTEWQERKDALLPLDRKS